MKSFIAATLIAALASTVSAQQASSGCDENYSGTFEIAPYNVTANIPTQGQTTCTINPIVTLKDGVLTDQDKRTGEVVANHQFQFDSPVQGPTTSGFCIYNNGSLALNGNAIFYGCASGGFSNLYDQSQGGQCYQIYIVTYPCTGSAGPIAGSSSPSSSSSSSSSSSTSSSSTSTLITSTTPVVASTPSTSSTALSTIPTVAPVPVPFPAGNSTTPAATASGATTTKSSSSSSSSVTPTATPTTFKGAANIVAVGSKVAAVVAGIAAFALV